MKPPWSRQAPAGGNDALLSAYKEEDYQGGEMDVLIVNAKAGDMSWQQLCAEVNKSGDTVMEFDSTAETELFRLIDDDSSGHISLEEIENAAYDARIVEFVAKAKQPTLTHMMERSNHKGKHNNKSMERAFANVDTDGSGSISREEWSEFILQMRRERVLYLKQYMFINQNCYLGLGLEPGEEYADPLAGWPFMGGCGLVRRKCCSCCARAAATTEK